MLTFAHVTEIGVSSMSATNLDPVWLNSEPAQMDKSGPRAQRHQVPRTDKAGQPGCVDLLAHSPSQGQFRRNRTADPRCHPGLRQGMWFHARIISGAGMGEGSPPTIAEASSA